MTMHDLSKIRPSGLLYYSDDQPGITRRRCGSGFAYYASDGTLIRDRKERDRITAIAVPPAYDEVWITPHPNGHLQATGRDARGRKQYRYHPDWSEHRATVKFDQLSIFGRALPRLRGFIARSLGAETGSAELALGTVLALIDRASIRIGNQAYATQNQSFGATTLLGRHVRFRKDRLILSFPSKGGARIRRTLSGPALQRAMSRIHDLPGAALATWLDESQIPHVLRSEQVNAVIAEICGEGMTAKTFRTWNGTHAAFCIALRPGPVTIAEMAEAAAERLDNTAAVARKSYVHPAVIDLARLDPDQRLRLLRASPGPGLSGLRSGESELIGLLER
ncbi:DNA topoisomerase IB [Defluviimonas sp. WL0002]|uniref:DNA topoisomerase n=1 Tax=Albidovulum marisflavi TaxID=2984159 RepID=A0ABT2ZCN2_9RHOB|nr:DNA topoisomerase IB [Defluviimonas sp. WL0002]MCV2868851.1 DNA topoisomerase IB [Defluviimonas sp. WL0002]